MFGQSFVAEVSSFSIISRREVIMSGCKGEKVLTMAADTDEYRKVSLPIGERIRINIYQ